MKLEELTSITTLNKDADICDVNGRLVARSTAIDSIPPFLNEVEVESILIRENGEMLITLQYEDPMKPIEHIRNIIAECEEAVSDEYRMADPEDVKREVIKYIKKIFDDSSSIYAALDLGKAWDCYLD